jgi:hypothetical protein
MKFFVTLPALPGKYIEVDSEDRINAALDALSITVWNEEEFLRAVESWEKHFPPMQKVNVCGEPE